MGTQGSDCSMFCQVFFKRWIKWYTMAHSQCTYTCWAITMKTTIFFQLIQAKVAKKNNVPSRGWSNLYYLKAIGMNSLARERGTRPREDRIHIWPLLSRAHPMKNFLWTLQASHFGFLSLLKGHRSYASGCHSCYPSNCNNKDTTFSSVLVPSCKMNVPE